MPQVDDVRKRRSPEERAARALNRISSSALVTRPVRTIAAGVFLGGLALYGCAWIVGLLGVAAVVIGQSR